MKRLCFLVVLCTVLVINGSSRAGDPNYTFDESTPGLVIVNNSGYAQITEVLGVPCIWVQIDDSATADIAIEQGHRYKVTARRQCVSNGNTGFRLDLNGTYYMMDMANNMSDPLYDQFVEEVYRGYYEPNQPVTTVKIHDGNPWTARVDWIKFEAIDDIYFDEKTADITYWGSSEPVNFTITQVLNSSMPVYVDPGNTDKTGVPGNGMLFYDADNGTVTGTVQLVPNTVYHVYSSRVVKTSGTLGYDVSLDSTTIHDDALTPTDDVWHMPEYYDDTLLEEHLGEFLSSGSGLINVVLNNPGSDAARVDYLRFVPSTCGDIDHAYSVVDVNKDCNVDTEDLSDPNDGLIDYWLNITDVAGGHGQNLFTLGSFEDENSWFWEGDPNGADTEPNTISYHVTTSKVGNGRGDTGNAITFTDSVWVAEPFETWLNYRSEWKELAVNDYIPDNSVVYIGCWAKLSADFSEGDPSLVPPLGVEIRLSLGTGTKDESYWSYSGFGINSLVLGWGGPGFKSADMSTEWQYFEHICQVGDSENIDGWSWMLVNVHDRVPWRGDLAGEWQGTVYIDDIYVGKVSQLPQPPGPGDYGEDGIVNFHDFVIFSFDWFECTDPQDRACDQYWLP